MGVPSGVLMRLGAVDAATATDTSCSSSVFARVLNSSHSRFFSFSRVRRSAIVSASCASWSASLCSVAASAALAAASAAADWTSASLEFESPSDSLSASISVRIALVSRCDAARDSALNVSRSRLASAISTSALALASSAAVCARRSCVSIDSIVRSNASA